MVQKRRGPKITRPSNDNPAGRARATARPAWQGHLRLSLVSCPITLVNATSRTADISFHLINPETNNRIKMVTTDPESGPVSRSDLVKGYEIAKGEYVILTSEDFEAVKLESTRTLDIERFVDADMIDRLYWDTPYFLVPDGNEAINAYSVIHQAMLDSNRIALGRVVMHTRERLVAIEPRGKGLVAYTLRMDNEVRDPDEAFSMIPDTTPDKQMTAIAEQIIQQKEGVFEPKEFVDRYEEALKALIEDKRKGRKPVRSAEPDNSNVIDLMAALKRSLKPGDAAKKGAAGKDDAAKAKRSR